MVEAHGVRHEEDLPYTMVSWHSARVRVSYYDVTSIIVFLSSVCPSFVTRACISLG